MLSVVVLTRRQPAANALLNRVQDVVPVRRVYFESHDRPQDQLSWRTARGAALQLRKRALYYRQRAESVLAGTAELETRALDQVFGHRWKSIERPAPTSELEDKDWGRCAAELAQDPPDVILVLGTSLIPDSVTRLAKIAALNIHTGLSPHYRGANCSEFAILNEDFENIGTTVHIVRKQIDGGEIIHQSRPQIVAGDTEHSLNAKVQRLGIEDYAEILGRLERGEVLRPVRQPKDVGLLLMFRAYTPGHVRLVRELIAGGAVERYLERQARGKAQPPKPIVGEMQMGVG